MTPGQEQLVAQARQHQHRHLRHKNATQPMARPGAERLRNRRRIVTQLKKLHAQFNDVEEFAPIWREIEKLED